MMRALIVDDEPLARERLRTLLQSEIDVEIVGECSNGFDALAAIRTERPDLVFLDVQMPELDGFGVMAKLAGEAVPLVIFVTAYDRFALQAFEVHALDYLLKPFDRERFQKTLLRARHQLHEKHAGDQFNQRLSALLADFQRESPATGRLALKSDGRVLLLKLDEIDWIEAADNYVNIHVGGESHLNRETLAACEARLPTRQFARISRSIVVNLDRIKELRPMFHGDYTVILRNGTKLTLTRSYRDKLPLLLGKLA